MRRGAAIACVAVVSSLAVPGCAKRHTGTDPVKQVLLITIDTLRADRIRCYGDRQAETPGLDALAASGARFEQVHAHNVVTLPSHANILSGLCPIAHGVRDNSGFRFPTSTDTLATLLKKQGFECAAFVGAFPVDSRFGLDRGFDLYDDRYGDATRAPAFRFIERPAEQVVDAFEAWLGSRSPGAKWFAWIHLYDPHSPYDPPEPYRTRFAGRPYDGEIAYTDSQIGRLVQHLKDKKAFDGTLLIVTADHGESLGDHSEPTHGVFAYEATLRVPLIVTGPGVSPHVVRTRVRHVDVAPTILEEVGLPIPGSLNGRSLRALLNATSDLPAADCYFEAISANLNRGWAPLTGVLSGRFKYVDLPVAELYDLESDPLERSNLAVARADLVADLRSKLESLMKTATPIQRTAEDPETVERLRSLGYVSGTAPAAARRYTVEDDPKNLIDLDNRLDQGMEAASTGNLEGARAIFQSIIDKRPTMSIAYGHLAYVLRQMGRYEEAIAVLERALKLGLDSADVLARLGQTLDEAGHADRAVPLLERAVRMSADNTDSLTWLGMAYAHAGRPQQALDSFRKILEQDPDNASAYSNMGTVYLAQGDYPKAMEVLQKAIALDSGFAQAHNSMGVALVSTGNPEAAIASWRRAIELDPHQYDTIFNLAILYLKLGRGGEARPYMEQFVRTAPPSRYASDIQQFRKMLATQ